MARGWQVHEVHWLIRLHFSEYARSWVGFKDEVTVFEKEVEGADGIFGFPDIRAFPGGPKHQAVRAEDVHYFQGALSPVLGFVPCPPLVGGEAAVREFRIFP